MRGLATVACALAVTLLSGGPLKAQEYRAADPDLLAPRWFVHSGLSDLWVDFGEANQRHLGFALTTGVTWNAVETGVLASVWQWESWRLASVEAQGGLPIRAGPTSALDLVLGVGYTWSDYLGEPIPFVTVVETSGAAANLGLRYRFDVRSGWSVRTGIFMRTDAGGWNGEWRVMAGWRQPSQTPSQPASHTTDFRIRVYYMVPVGGPWRFVRPGYALAARRSITPTISAALTLAFFHWEIPGQAFLRDYLWNTGSFVAFPAAQWSTGERVKLAVRAGPAVVMMGEGPDNGVTLGPDLEAELEVDVGGIEVDLGAGWMWILRGWDDDPDYGGDQHGLMLFGGIGF